MIGHNIQLALLLAMVVHKSWERNIDPAIVAAIIRVESNWTPNAIGDDRHSFGLMQLHIQGAGSGHNPSSLLDPETNLDVGLTYLQRCLEATNNDLPATFSAYNQGIQGWHLRGTAFNQIAVDRYMHAYEEYRLLGVLQQIPKALYGTPIA